MNVDKVIFYCCAGILCCMLLVSCSDLFHDTYEEEKVTERVNYLVATKADGDDGRSNFTANVRYRMLAFTQGYEDPSPEPYVPASMIRFNEVVTEQETGQANHKYIKVDDVNRDLSFNPSTMREDIDSRNYSHRKRTLDFYGFTDGNILSSVGSDYLALSRVNAPADVNVANYYDNPQTYYLQKNVETKDGYTVLADIMHGKLLNQNMVTAPAHCKIPFRHCFSQLNFLVSQSPSEQGSTVGKYNISVQKITVKGTYSGAKIGLADGKVTITGNPVNRVVKPLSTSAPSNLTTVPVQYGNIVLMPSDANTYNGIENGDGSISTISYPLSLSVTLRGSQSDISEFGVAVPVAGTNLYETTLDNITIKNTILEEGEAPGTVTDLYLKAGFTYSLNLLIDDGMLYLISAVPSEVQWLPGEGNDVANGYDYELKSTGRPTQFGGNIWMDRNLGAEAWDTTDPDEYIKTTGFFYQSFRNIPYWPYFVKYVPPILDASTNADITSYTAATDVANRYKRYSKYYPSSAPDFRTDFSTTPIPRGTTRLPKLADRWSYSLANAGDWRDTRFFMFPALPDRIIDKAVDNWKYVSFPITFTTSNFITSSTAKKVKTSLVWGNNMRDTVVANTAATEIEELETYNTWNKSKTYSFSIKYNNKSWENGTSEQPAVSGWHIPTKEDFYKIMPSTPIAGNYAFRTGGTPGDQMFNSTTSARMSSTVNILRVCIPYYTPNMAVPAATSKYRAAYDIWKSYGDPGSTLNNYESGKGPVNFYNAGVDPVGDPEPGKVSVYLIVDKDDDFGSRIHFPQELIDANAGLNPSLKSWGTIYAIKNYRSSDAYAIRWRLEIKSVFKPELRNYSPMYYLRVDRYRLANPSTTTLDELSYLDIDWNRPAATMYFPVSGMAETNNPVKDEKSSTPAPFVFGGFYHFGFETLYCTSSRSGESAYYVRIKAPFSGATNNLTIGVIGPGPKTYAGQVRLVQN